MKMEIFEYNIYVKKENVVGTNDLELAKEIAHQLAIENHCDVDVINAFTGEVHCSYVSYLHITYNADNEEIEKIYEVKEREW